MMTGLMYSRGELVFLIDSDLEEEPEWLLQFNHQMNKHKCDVIYGVQIRRKGRFFERWSGVLFYLLFNMLSGLELPDNLVTARLMTRRYVNALKRHQEREILIAGLWQITGFAQQSYPVTKRSRSKTTYSFKKKMSHLVNSVTSFSNAPLIGIFYAGVLISLFSIAYIIWLAIHWLFCYSIKWLDFNYGLNLAAWRFNYFFCRCSWYLHCKSLYRNKKEALHYS